MVEYKDTLNLPQTAFEMRAGLARKEPKLLAQWDATDLYGEIQRQGAEKPRYVMHDGPPYANGHLHHGHILNKILKDIVVKDRNMRGLRTGFIPGWDCHGLPIEVQVDKELGRRKAELSKAEIRQACRAYAERFVGIQRDEFKRLGVLARWDQPYLTMRRGYEATIVRELAKFAAAGLLYKGLRPVNWCTVHQTALAEAEVEYEDHSSPSIYVAFPLEKVPVGLEGEKADLVIWTTTPWTLPANLAIAVHPRFDYVAYPVGGRWRVVARELLPGFLSALGEPELDPKQLRGGWKGTELEGLSYQHPLYDRTSPVVLGEHVTLDAGTGCVHTAPGHGPDDFEMGRKYQLGVLSPVDDRGRFTDEAGPFAGQPVFEANAAIIEALVAVGALLNSPEDTVSHRYAHCWRCHRPIILRATEQWFVAIDRRFGDGPSLRERALRALDDVQWIPPWGEDRIRGMLEARPDWCLSRQRTWGVPIPVLYCEGCQTPLLDVALMNRVADKFEQEGADVWFTASIESLVGALTCPQCGGHDFRREQDILDVWFESGVSFAAVIEREREAQTDGPAVDLYLEGSDQHRGWFHSALLCGLATRGAPPYRTVLTHGFVVDGAGKKISKSKGNFVDPFKAVSGQGAEMLRLWTAYEDYREDIRISPEILKRLSDTYRKVRNTIRYLLGNLHDFAPDTDLLAADALEPFDRYMLRVCRQAIDRMLHGYETFELHMVLQRLVELCIVELSAYYLDVLKDRLYAEARTSHARRSAQTALYVICRDLLRIAAPIFSFTAEEAWAQLPRMAGDPESVHLAMHPRLGEPAPIAQLWRDLDPPDSIPARVFETVRGVRNQINGALENARKEKRIGSSVEAAVSVTVPEETFRDLEALGEKALADLFIVSQVSLAEGETTEVVVGKARGTKCARCWLYREDVGVNPAHPTICRRCVEAI